MFKPAWTSKNMMLYLNIFLKILKLEDFFIISHLPNSTTLSEIKSNLFDEWGHAFGFTENKTKYLDCYLGCEIISSKGEGILQLAFGIWFKKED